MCVCVWAHVLLLGTIRSHPPEHVIACWLIGTHTLLSGNAGRLMRMLFYWLIHWNIQHVITLKTCFSERGRQAALNKCLICDWGCVICLMLAGRRQSEWESHSETAKEKQKGSKSINELDIHILPLPQPCSSMDVISAVYPGLWRLPDNGWVICSCSFLDHLRATIIVLSV